MKGAVFEQPSVAAVARDFIRQYDAVDRVDAMDGNYVTDEIGGY